MTRDAAALRTAWETAARTTRDVLESGADAAFLTIGDPLVYSTFGYLLRPLRTLAPHLPVEIVPGVTSIQAAAARAQVVLCENGETLRLIPGINRQDDLTAALKDADTAVILKAYRNLPAIREALRRTGRLKDCVLASLVERPGEHIRTGLPENDATPPYMSLILSRKPTDAEG